MLHNEQGQVMATNSRIVLALAFPGSFLVVGVPYWQIPYAQVSLPNSVWGLSLVVVGALAALPTILSGTRFWSSALIVGVSVPAAVLARIIYDTWSDPTSHNLWPFEIILATGPGLLAGIIGAFVGGLLTKRHGAWSAGLLKNPTQPGTLHLTNQLEGKTGGA